MTPYCFTYNLYVEQLVIIANISTHQLIFGSTYLPTSQNQKYLKRLVYNLLLLLHLVIQNPNQSNPLLT